MIVPSKIGAKYSEPYIYINIESRQEMKVVLTASFKNNTMPDQAKDDFINLKNTSNIEKQ
jgi:hypothetical protein